MKVEVSLWAVAVVCFFAGYGFHRIAYQFFSALYRKYR